MGTSWIVMLAVVVLGVGGLAAVGAAVRRLLADSRAFAAGAADLLTRLDAAAVDLGAAAARLPAARGE